MTAASSRPWPVGEVRAYTPVQKSLERLNDEDHAEYKRGLRRRVEHLVEVSHNEFDQNHPGHPLGVGMPTGDPIRGDTSHGEGWKDVLRRDVCVYCGRQGGTIDHVQPQSKPESFYLVCPTTRVKQPVGEWTNLVGACASCNTSKSDEPLLLFLARRRGVVVTRSRPAASSNPEKAAERSRRRAKKKAEADRRATATAITTIERTKNRLVEMGYVTQSTEGLSAAALKLWRANPRLSPEAAAWLAADAA